MPADIRWDNEEKTILVVTFAGDIPREEFLAIFDREDEMFASVDHPVYLIGDFRSIGRMSVDILGLSSMISRKLPNNMGGIVIVGTSSILDTIFGIWSKLYKKIGIVKTMEEAYQWLDRLMSDPGA